MSHYKISTSLLVLVTVITGNTHLHSVSYYYLSGHNTKPAAQPNQQGNQTVKFLTCRAYQPGILPSTQQHDVEENGVLSFAK